MAIRRVLSSPSSGGSSIPTTILIVMIAFVFGAVIMYLLGNNTSSMKALSLSLSQPQPQSQSQAQSQPEIPSPKQTRGRDVIVIKNEAAASTIGDDNPFIYEDVGNLRRPPSRPFYYPSRGLAQPYQQFGILISSERRNTGEQTILPLIGRQTYPGSSRYHYYTSTNGYHPMKLPVSHRNRTCNDMTGCEEIFSGNIVSVPGYDYDFKADIYPSPDFNYIQ
jgi:hypothetical protein